MLTQLNLNGLSPHFLTKSGFSQNIGSFASERSTDLTIGECLNDIKAFTRRIMLDKHVINLNINK